MKRWMVFLIVLLMVWIVLPAVDASAPRVVRAQQVKQEIKLDGELSENVWNGNGYSGFIQRDPNDGEPATEKTTVWVAYDDKNLYVAARMFDQNPRGIISRLGRRDDFLDSDWFVVAVDPYFDKRSGFRFCVNPAGSIMDHTLFNDEWDDSTWDGVWEAAARIDDQGWTVEMRIPFTQLRFKKKDSYVWGINFHRIIKRKNEELWYAWVAKEDSGYVSRFARLEGISDIKPGRNIEFLPYAAGKAGFSPGEEGNPFDTGSAYLGLAGLDFKVGLKSNLILDATVNPDFGQVEVDPAVINLSAYETYYSEKRPFFIEGANIFRFGKGGATDFWGFNWGSPSFFYSRRIGRAPQGAISGDYDYADFPEWTTILTAAKVTGQIGDGWNLGFLNALTAREYARFDLGGVSGSEEVEPFSYYGVFRTQKDFNEGRQGLGMIATAVIRDPRNESLAEVLAGRAFALAVDGWTFFDKEKVWVISGWAGATRISGEDSAIADRQLSALHYFQRPDADHVELDETATSIDGWAARFTVNKQKGNLMLNAALGAISPGFDSTDLGFQWRADLINGHVGVGYRWLKPGKVFRNAFLIGAIYQSRDFGWNRTGEGYFLLGGGEFKNYWNVEMMTFFEPEVYNNDLTRGGPLMLSPSTWVTNWHMSTDSRKPVIVGLHGNLYRSRSGSNGFSASLNLRFKPSSNVSLSVGPNYRFRRGAAQWVDNIDDEFMTATYGTRYLFGEIDQQTLSASIRLNWTFTPRLSLQAYIQPFIAVGDYYNLKELARPGSFEFNHYGEGGSTIDYDAEAEEYTLDPDGAGPASAFVIGDPDFNFKSLRGTVVLRWEYRPGSALYLVWTQNRRDYAHPGSLSFGRDFRDMLTAEGSNIFMIKFTYRFQL